MKIDLYTLSWNEAEILPFFFRHYDDWIDRYFVYDDGSTDDTIDMLGDHPRVELRRFTRTDSRSFVESHRNFHNHVWKASRGVADWVVITALDEHLTVPGADMREYLAARKQEGVSHIPALGYQMISDAFPAAHERLSESRVWGAPYSRLSKLSVFDPDAVTETNFDHGRHGARPSGRLALPEHDELLLLHYKFLGFERTLARLREQHSGLREKDLARGWGRHYSWTREELQKRWDEWESRTIDVSRSDPRPWAAHDGPRWWREAEPDAASPAPDARTSPRAERANR